MDAPPLELRPATVADAPAIARLVHTCFSTYRSFTGPEWDPPGVEWHSADLQSRLPGVGVRTRVASPSRDAHPVAFCAWMPSRSKIEPRLPVPGLAHLWMLFVDPGRWGSGLSGKLLDWAHDGMRAAEYEAARLWTPTDQARARAFYERHGWRATGHSHFSQELGLEVAEYRVALA